MAPAWEKEVSAAVAQPALVLQRGQGPPASGVKVALLLLKELELSAVGVRFALALQQEQEQALEAL